MGRNTSYYEALGLEPGAVDADIAKQFRILALTYHPERNLQNQAEAIFIFS